MRSKKKMDNRVSDCFYSSANSKATRKSWLPSPSPRIPQILESIVLIIHPSSTALLSSYLDKTHYLTSHSQVIPSEKKSLHYIIRKYPTTLYAAWWTELSIRTPHPYAPDLIIQFFLTNNIQILFNTISICTLCKVEPQVQVHFNLDTYYLLLNCFLPRWYLLLLVGVFRRIINLRY